MPYSVEDVDKHKKGLTARQKRQWVAIANSVLRQCMDDGGDEGECAASAIRQANGVVGNEASFHSYRQPASNYEIRHEVHQGRKHMVVPVVMMIEGVHNGSHGPLLHLAEDLGKFLGVWNGIPISIHHPEENGGHISANQPNIIDSQVVGRVYNTAIDGGKLKAEAWLDEEALQRVSAEAYEHLVMGRPLDVSIGVFTEEDLHSGEWNGRRYEAIARNHRPDHLALLPGGVGACSWADGCGVRTHEKGGGALSEDELKVYGIRYSGTESIAWSAPTLGDFGVEGAKWEDLSQPDRAKVASHYLVGSANDDFGDLKFPVVNPKTGKLSERALRAVIGGRGAQANVSAAQRVAARRTAYRLLNSEFDAGLEVPDSLSALAKELAHDGLKVNEIGFREIAQKIQAKLDRMDDDSKLHFLEECFDDHFVYRLAMRSGEPDGETLYQRSYSVNDDGTVEFTGESVAVTKKVEYVTMKKSEEGDEIMAKEKDVKPCCPEKVELLIQSEHTKFDEGDREWLLALSEEQLGKLEVEPPAERNEEEPDLEAAREELMQMSQNQAIKVLEEKFSDPKKAMELFPKEIREQMEHGLQLYKQHRAETIQRITSNTDVFTEEELKDKPMAELEKLAKAIKPRADYSPMAPSTHSQEQEVLLPLGVE
jgi:hypothetical protein